MTAALAEKPHDLFAGSETLQKIYNYLIKYSQIAQGLDDLYYREATQDELGITITVEPLDRLVPGTIKFAVQVANFRPLKGTLTLIESRSCTNIYLYDTEGNQFYSEGKKNIYHANIKKVHKTIYEWACHRNIKDSLGIHPSKIGIHAHRDGLNWITRFDKGEVFLKCLFVQTFDRAYKYNLPVFETEEKGTNTVRIQLRNFTRDKFKEIEQLTAQYHQNKFYTAQRKRLLLKEYIAYHKLTPTEKLSSNLYGVEVAVGDIVIILKAGKILLKVEETENITLLNKITMMFSDNQFQKWCELQQVDVLPVTTTIKLA